MADVAPDAVVQFVGGIGGTVLAHLMFDLARLAIGDHGRVVGLGTVKVPDQPRAGPG